MAEVLDSYNPGNEKEPDSCLAIERGTTSDEFVPLLMVQNQDSSPKQQGAILFIKGRLVKPLMFSSYQFLAYGV